MLTRMFKNRWVQVSYFLVVTSSHSHKYVVLYACNSYLHLASPICYAKSRQAEERISMNIVATQGRQLRGETHWHSATFVIYFYMLASCYITMTMVKLFTPEATRKESKWASEICEDVGYDRQLLFNDHSTVLQHKVASVRSPLFFNSWVHPSEAHHHPQDSNGC